MPTGLAERLGYAADEKVVIVHCDDLGMCHAANVGAFEALDAGPATCGSIMVPCPWFRESVEMAKARPGVDLGVHITLNSEWPQYRWGPVAPASEVPSLVDAEGYLHRTSAETLEHAKPDEAAREMRAQIERALGAGIDVSHLDAHMGTAFLPPFAGAYADLAIEFRLPALALRPEAGVMARLGEPAAGEALLDAIDRLEAAGIPLLDGLDANSLSFAPGEGTAHNEARLDAIGPGVHYLICHPAKGGDELTAIAPEAHARDFERTFYGGEAGQRALAERGIRTLGMREIRDLVRA